MDDSLHHRANFPSNLAISCERRPGREDLCAKQNHFGDNLAAFGIAAKTWDASFAPLDYLLPPRNTDCLRRRPRMEKLKLVLGTITVQRSTRPFVVSSHFRLYFYLALIFTSSLDNRLKPQVGTKVFSQNFKLIISDSKTLDSAIPIARTKLLLLTQNTWRCHSDCANQALKVRVFRKHGSAISYGTGGSS
ncbi:hypothetical protein PtA15_10A518 [Puccinia triticina]|uniref:Uncharacterized protein n=1 Tax=Puccinia triticina TaxID=208348 RepID=A0ABY7CVU8_9BASI|nr:uncharacterized protein PtA15_10A518 [Puccinia triticina]WAQ89095.1 hypothetical protein PtA15_10A518 [Puccinia triticina]